MKPTDTPRQGRFGKRGGRVPTGRPAAGLRPPSMLPVWDGAAAFTCGPADVGFDECWNCGGSNYWLVIQKHGEPFRDENGRGRYCSLDCADEASEANLTGRMCTTCGKQEGHCSTGHPEDPHVFLATGGAA